MFPSSEPIVTSLTRSLTRQTFDKTTDGYRVMPKVAGSYPKSLALYRGWNNTEDLHKRYVYVNVIFNPNLYILNISWIF